MKKYKETSQYQLSLLPPSLDELIDSNHLVRLIDSFVNVLPSRLWDDIFTGGGAPCYHPAIMLKVILYAYSQKIYSCRNIAKAVRQDITFMWLVDMERPSFNTINRFRTEYFKNILEDIFTELLDFLHGKGHISYQDFFVDGTKLEANAGRYTHVWKKNTSRYKAAVKQRVHALLFEIDELNQAEQEQYGANDLSEEQVDISSEELQELACKLSTRFEKVSNKKVKRKLQTKTKHLKQQADKLAKYEDQESLLDGRNSYSKTDTDATFMRMKNDSLRAAYNVQISTENQFVTNYSISQNASDTITFPEHLDKIKERGQSYMPKNYMGDSACGSEENYTLLADNNIESYLKYNTFHPEKKSAFKTKKPFHPINFTCNHQEDCFICPEGKRLDYQRTYEAKSKTGFSSLIRVYGCQACNGCSFKSQCTKSATHREIHYNAALSKFKEYARDNLDSDYGLTLRKRRGFEVETFFGDLRQNCRFNRFSVRGLAKTEHELGLLAMAHNLRKLANIQANNTIDSVIFIFSKIFRAIFNNDPVQCAIFHLLPNYRLNLAFKWDF